MASGRKEARKVRPPLLPESLWAGLPEEEAGDAPPEQATPCGKVPALRAAARTKTGVKSYNNETYTTARRNNTSCKGHKRYSWGRNQQ